MGVILVLVVGTQLTDCEPVCSAAAGQTILTFRPIVRERFAASPNFFAVDETISRAFT